jgi:hypothetical protein
MDLIVSNDQVEVCGSSECYKVSEKELQERLESHWGVHIKPPESIPSVPPAPLSACSPSRIQQRTSNTWFPMLLFSERSIVIPKSLAVTAYIFLAVWKNMTTDPGC